MKKFRLFVFVFAFMIAFGVLGKANLSSAEWSIELKPMWMDVKGNDVRVGDVFRYTETIIGVTTLYGVAYEPITLDMKDRLTLRTEIQHKKGQQGFGISGWWFDR